ncbi:MAG: methionyl-tRNA formyltransferase [Ottowia sp.]|nr:MAG: methionyl-tRNA formyltransferase [Ottowia sp.]
MIFRVVFAGTPEFARVALAQLLAAGFEVPLVLTQPDRPAGRGLKLHASPVKKLAEQHGIPVAQPRSLRLDGKYPEDAAAARAALQAARADVMVVAAYGLILPQWVLDDMSTARPPEGAKAPSGGSAPGAAVERGGLLSAARPSEGARAPSGGSATGAAVERGGLLSAARPPEGAKAPSGGSATGAAVERGGLGLGCLNIHASLLPRWRGAAPIHRAIEAGDARTGITIMQMDAGLDTGDMLLVQALPIGPRATTASLHDELAALGGQLIVQALQQAGQGTLRSVPQPAEGVSYAHKIDKHEAAIDWRQPAALIERRIRAFDPFPGASTTLGDAVIKLWRSEIDSSLRTPDARCGQILAINDAGITVACGDGALRLTELQRPGGKRLPAREFLRGFALAPGQCLGQAGDAP